MVRGRPSRLTEERVKLLEDLSFVWEASRRRLEDGGSSENETHGDEDGSDVLKAAVSKKKRPRAKMATISTDAPSNGNDDGNATIPAPANASLPPQGPHSPMHFASQQHYHPQQQLFSPCGVGPGWGQTGFDPTSPQFPPPFAAGPGMGSNPPFFFPPAGAMMPFPGMMMQVPGGMPYVQGQMGAAMFPGGMTVGGGMHQMMMHQNVPGQPDAESVGTGAPLPGGALSQDNEDNHMSQTAAVKGGPQMSLPEYM